MEGFGFSGHAGGVVCRAVWRGLRQRGNRRRAGHRGQRCPASRGGARTARRSPFRQDRRGRRPARPAAANRWHTRSRHRLCSGAADPSSRRSLQPGAEAFPSPGAGHHPLDLRAGQLRRRRPARRHRRGRLPPGLPGIYTSPGGAAADRAGEAAGQGDGGASVGNQSQPDPRSRHQKSRPGRNSPAICPSAPSPGPRSMWTAGRWATLRSSSTRSPPERMP
jgi:hypothetical protein